PRPAVPATRQRIVRVARKEAVSDRAVLLELLAIDGALLEPFAPGAPRRTTDTNGDDSTRPPPPLRPGQATPAPHRGAGASPCPRRLVHSRGTFWSPSEPSTTHRQTASPPCIAD